MFDRCGNRLTPIKRPHYESTFSRQRLEINCADMVGDWAARHLSLEACGIWWRWLPYFHGVGGAYTLKFLATLANIEPRKLTKYWPELERFFTANTDGTYAFKGFDWIFPYTVPLKQDREPLRHLLDRLVSFWGRACAYCRNPDERLDVEHIVPVSRGGGNELTNLTVACRRCNNRKHTKTAAEFGFPEIHERAQRIH